MAGNSFGKLFILTTFGESHGTAIGGVIDGCPSNVELNFEAIQKELDRVLSTPNRGVKQAGFHVLVGASMPNVLIELGFISNSDESKLLGRSSYRRKIARSIFNALVNFKDKYETPLIVD